MNMYVVTKTTLTPDDRHELTVNTDILFIGYSLLDAKIAMTDDHAGGSKELLANKVESCMVDRREATILTTDDTFIKWQIVEIEDEDKGKVRL